MDNCTIRFAAEKDLDVILSFIHELAKYEKLTHELSIEREGLRHGLFGPRPYAECLIAEVENKPAGFSVFFHIFPTFLGKPGIHIEDVFVKPEYRHQGIGSMLFSKISEIALDRDCGRMEWWVLDWNQSAIDFYKKLGAEPQSEWIIQRLVQDKIERLVEQSTQECPERSNKISVA